jgi:aminoglycoside phosphotransferase family enzyme
MVKEAFTLSGDDSPENHLALFFCRIENIDMIVLRSASTPPLALLCVAESSPYISTIHAISTLQRADCQIADWNSTPAALLFLVDHKVSGQRLVIKILRPYRDTRYNLETLSERQQCLLEALERNRVFTPELYIGLAPLYNLGLSQGTISIGEVMEYPTASSLDADTEYVLLMKPQEQETRLDYLLARGEFASLVPLIEYVADLHNRKVFDLSLEESKRWGSYDYLMYKLEHNLELLDFLVSRCDKSDWDDRKELAERAMQVKKMGQEIAAQEWYRQYFHQRVTQGCIKLCHGDIKSPHIWIASDGSKGEEKWSFNLLDAIDFNPMYNHIDLLSDFAMLLADVQAHAPSPVPLNEMVDSYLQKTHQNSEEARRVLDYYVMEKAIVGAGISILYDGKPQLGRTFLKVAESSLESMRVAVPV